MVNKYPHFLLRQRGASLLMALMLVVLVTSIVAGVSFTTNYAIRRSAIISHNQQAAAYTDGAVVLAKKLLKIDGLITQSDDAQDNWAKQKPAYPVEGGEVQGTIHELSSRYNLKHLELNDDFEKTVFKRLWQSLGGNDTQAQKILLSIKRQPYYSVIGAFVAADIDEAMIHKVAPYFTYLPINAEKLNINLVSAHVFAAYFNMTVARARIILNPLKDNAVKNDAELQQFAQKQGLTQIKVDASRQNASAVIKLRFGVKSRYFQIVSEATVGESHAVKVVTVDRGRAAVGIISQRLNKLAHE